MNWGKGITLALIAFMSFIIYMAVVLISKSTDLVTPEYYKDEVQFEKEITAQQNAMNNQSKLDLDLSPEGLFIKLDTPDDVKLLDITLYRPNTKDGDIILESKGKNAFIEGSQLKKGRYLLTAEWEAQNQSYQMRDTLWIP
ncbi:FixH family protein [Brumimicrobium sp.]|uniref:FixH family protein n=1 Tax=Brumimicrobium sp. TaxID=2029867 RepID=UPI00260D49EE|nr:FixH family protein [uncultured Brumimicrobium sp.]